MIVRAKELSDTKQHQHREVRWQVGLTPFPYVIQVAHTTYGTVFPYLFQL